MRKLLAPHLAGQWATNLELLRQWQPPLALVLSPDVDKVRDLRAACPDTIIIGRFYHEDSYYAQNISTRPEEFAQEIHNEIVANPVTPLLDYVQSNNETNQDWAGIQQLNKYASRWMALADEAHAYKCAILAFSVGNPDLPDKPGDPAGFDGRMLYWQQVLPSLNYAQRNNHLLLLHAYGYPDLFHPDADWYIYRYEQQVQDNLRTLGITDLRYAYGEIGIDRLIVADKGGYKAVPTTDQDYVNQLLQWERDQQSQALLLGGAIFTFGDSGGWGSYDITTTNAAAMLAQHYADHAAEYAPPSAASAAPTTVYIPYVANTTTTAPALPPREWDERLTARGVTVQTPAVAPGQQFWRVVKARWYDEQESQGRHHIYANILDSFGNLVGPGHSLYVEWSSDHTLIYTEEKPGDEWKANYAMSPSRNDYGISVNDGLAESEKLVGIGMGADTPSGFNAGIHTSTGVTFQLVTMPAADTGTVTVTEPPSTGTPAEPPPAADDWPRIYAFIQRWEGGFVNDPNDPGGATNKGITIDTYTQWRRAHGQPQPTVADLRGLPDADAEQIFREWYYEASGADALPWPLSLAQTDTAVNAGVGRAQEMLVKSGGNFLAYMGHLITWYASINGFEHFGRAWMRRRADLLLEASK